MPIDLSPIPEDDRQRRADALRARLRKRGEDAFLRVITAIQARKPTCIEPVAGTKETPKDRGK
jgi:hypothetical protein